MNRNLRQLTRKRYENPEKEKFRKRGLGSRGAHSQASAWDDLIVNPCLGKADGSKPEEKNYQEGYSKSFKELNTLVYLARSHMACVSGPHWPDFLGIKLMLLVSFLIVI